MLALKLIWRTSRLLTLACVVLVLIAGSLPVAYMVTTGIVVGAVPTAVREGLRSPAGGHLLLALGVLAAIYVTESAMSSIRVAITASLGSRYVLNLRGEVFDATLGPAGIGHLEDAATADELRITAGADARWYAEQLVQNLANVFTMKITGIGSAAIVFAFEWWAPLVLVVPALLSFRWINREIDTFLNLYIGSTPEMRRSDYLRDLGVRPDAAKELRVFGLARWLVDWYGASWREAMRPQWKARRGHAAPLVHMTIAQLIAGAVTIGILCRAAFIGEISIGELATYVAALQGMRALGAEGDNEMAMLRGIKTVGRLIKLKALTAGPSSDLEGARQIVRSGTVRFDDVSFTYPGTTTPVLDGLSLEIPKGRSLAIVGLNGAGKTTLTKLLARLYDVDHGRITVDGIDIRDLDPGSWRRRIGVIFQDFIRFELPARANVGFGAVELTSETDVLDRVAAKAGATSVIERLPDGWDTVLSRGYENGTELSGGEWQRIALGRALMALEGGADILVLDEPTANLDVRAEADIFDRFLDLTAGATTILISHRFSTVRNADRIVVIEHGRVIELGTHESLVAENGRYAHLFRLQAERFAESLEGDGA